MADLPDHLAALRRLRRLSAKIGNQHVILERGGTLVDIGGRRQGIALSPSLDGTNAMAATQSALRNGLARRTLEADTGEGWTFQIEEEAAVMLLSGRGEIGFTPLQVRATDTWATPHHQERVVGDLARTSA